MPAKPPPPVSQASYMNGRQWWVWPWIYPPWSLHHSSQDLCFLFHSTSIFWWFFCDICVHLNPDVIYLKTKIRLGHLSLSLSSYHFGRPPRLPSAVSRTQSGLSNYNNAWKRWQFVLSKLFKWLSQRQNVLIRSTFQHPENETCCLFQKKKPKMKYLPMQNIVELPDAPFYKFEQNPKIRIYQRILCCSGTTSCDRFWWSKTVKRVGRQSSSWAE